MDSNQTRFHLLLGQHDWAPGAVLHHGEIVERGTHDEELGPGAFLVGMQQRLEHARLLCGRAFGQMRGSAV